MGAIVAGGLTGLLNQSSAQVIDGSLKFNGGYLTRTPSSNGNRKTWTYSSWIKFDKNAAQSEPLLVAGNSSSDFTQVYTYKSQASDIAIASKTGSSDKVEIASNNLLRDTGWYHIVAVFDSSGSGYQTDSTIYINGVEISRNTNTFAGGLNYESWVNSTAEPHYLGYLWNGNTFKGEMSQVYLIDGQALGPESFGYTDGLTNTWRPKKYTGDYTIPASGIVYSSYGSGTVSGVKGYTRAFDGNLSLFCEPNDNSTVTFDFTSLPGGGITVGSSLRMYLNKAGSPAAGHFTVNGTNLGGSVPSGGWLTIGSVSRLDTITLYHASGSSSVELYAVEVDGSILTDGTAAQGANSFYLPMDGNSPIGDDKSGNGNNWTPVNFGGSVALDNPIVSGARPILNTDGGGNVARPGVFGSEVGAYYAVTVASVGGGNRYHFDGVDRPNPTLIRGATYTFDQSDSSNSNHPLRFATAADAAGSSQYTDGVTTNGTPGSAGAYTKITVPHNSPNTLHYYCTNHGGMGSSTSQITDETKADPYAWKCVLAMPLVGSDNDVSNQINSGSTTKTITVSNNAAASSDTSNFYNGSFEFDGTTDALTTSDLGGSVSQYTMECWINTDGFSQSQRPINASRDLNGNGYLYIETLTSKNIKIRQESTGSAESSGGVLSSGKWHHLALSYDGVRLRGFVDGVFVCQTSANGSPVSLPSVMKLRLGADESNLSAGDFDGYIQDARVYFGACKYTAATIGDQAFVVPATSPDILPDTPSGVSGSSKLTKITDGAVSFDGSGDSLSFATNSDFGLSGSDDFTIELFTYATSYTNSTSYSEMIRQGTGNAGSDGIYFHVKSTNLLEFRMSGTTKTTTGKVNAGGWNHISVCRSSGTLYMSINGVVENFGSVTNSSTTGDFKIGENFEGGHYYKGQLSNVRFVKGTALYTSNFTPPTAPLTNVTNTKLLCCQSNTSATAAAVIPTGSITANGNAAATNFNPFTTDINAVRGQETGYATFNVLRERSGGYNPTFSDGNLFMDGRGDGTGTLSASSGKFYFEVLVDTVGSSGQIYLGVQDAAYVGAERGWSTAQIAAMRDNNTLYGNGNTGSGATYGAGDLMSFAFDADNNKLYISKNGVYMNGGNPAQGTGFTHSGINFAGGYTPIVSDGSTGQKYRLNCGQKPFKFPPPAGFQPLNAANVRPETVITRPDHYVGATIYTGTTGAGTIKDDNIKFTPDFVWLKSRSNSEGHALYDTVRGSTGGNFYRLRSDTNAAQNSPTNELSSMIRGGFTVNNNGHCYYNGYTYAAWAWKAGGSKNTFNVDDVGYASASDVNMSVGALNSVSYDQSQTWSNNLAANTGSVSNPTYAFNGNLTNGADTSASTGSDDRILTATLGLTLNNEYVEVYPNHTYSGYYSTINGVKQTTQYFTSTGGWKIMGPFTGTLTSVSVTNGTESSNRPAGIRGIKVGGKLLVDNGVSVSNVPSIANTGASVGTKQGFSIVSYSGSGSNGTFSHGLLETPEFVIVKCRNVNQNWAVQHSAYGPTKYTYLNQDYEARTTGASAFWNDTAPTNSVVHVGTDNDTNASASGRTYIAYCWHNVPGLQKFGSYTGVNSTDGPFLELGFRPSIIMFKNISSGSTGWVILDNKRNGFNGTGGNNILFPNTSDAENTTQYGDFLSNGWKFRINSSYVNSTDTFIYAAWAETPTVNLFGAQSNAR